MALRLWLILVFQRTSHGTEQRVAIVGSGVAGASTAAFLHELLPSVSLDVFEASTEVGGRAHTIFNFGPPIDAGATSISTQNQYLVSFVNRFNLGRASDSSSDTLGLWDGSGFRFQWGTGSMLPLHVLLRYGMSPLNMIKAVRSAVSKLVKIYDLQANGVSFRSPLEMFDALGLTNLTQQSGYDMFKQLGVTEKFVQEFVDGASRDNYGQPSTINGFVDLVSLAGAGIDGSVFSLTNGTSQIPKELLRSCGDSASILTSTTVHRVQALPGGKFNVSFHSSAATSSLWRKYDGVVIATPLEAAKDLQLVNSVSKINTTRPYQQTCVTFVAGIVDPTYFGLATNQAVPTEILTIENKSLPFSTLAVHADLPNGTHVYKMFSREPVTEDLLDSVFKERFQTERLAWQAYPKLQPTPPGTWPPFVIPLGTTADNGEVFYTGAMETPVSCMETQIIAAKNAALQVAQSLRKQSQTKSSLQNKQSVFV